MKSHGGLFDGIVDVPNLERAATAAARGKRGKPDVERFLAAADVELPRLSLDLVTDCYRPRPYRQFRIRDPKPRTISCADFRDRVVHHAVCDVIGPLMERRFVFESYACRVGKGAHRAAARAQELARRYRYFLKLDVAAFFDSVDHTILLDLLGRTFREKRLLNLLEVIVYSSPSGSADGKGLPIGNLTSQWFANLYLDGLDHHVKETMRTPGYIRYMDDMLLFGDSKAFLWAAHDEIGGYLELQRSLSIKPTATALAPCAEGIPFLGLRVFPGTWRLQRAPVPAHAPTHARSRKSLSRRALKFGATGPQRRSGTGDSVLVWHQGCLARRTGGIASVWILARGETGEARRRARTG